jgi:beta-glucuronidase
VCLDGVWDFCFLGTDVDLDSIDLSVLAWDRRAPVPGCFDTLPSLAGVRGTAAYRTQVPARSGSRGLLKFHGLGLWGRVYVDGRAVHTCTLPYSGFQVVLEPAGPLREVVVVVDNRFDFARVPLQEQFFDFYAYGGLYRSVWYADLADLWVDRVRVTTRDLAAAAVEVQVILGGGEWDGIGAHVSFDGGAPQKVDFVACGPRRFAASLRVPGGGVWSPSAPVLHELAVTLPGGDPWLDRFGLRTVEARDGRVLVNGAPVKLLGYCRHEASMESGPALPLATLVADVERLKDLGCNFVRGSHYPQDPRWLDLCDEAGLLVFEEALGWGQRDRQFSDPEFGRQQEEQVRLMVRNSANHPSVILWGFLNEGASNSPVARPLYHRLAAAVRSEDPTRLVTFASMFPFDDLCLDLCDVVSVNQYPGWYAADREAVRPLGEIRPFLQKLKQSLASRGMKAKPLLISEIGAGALYGWRDALNAHWTEDYQADFLEETCRAIVDDPDYCGVSLWQFHDVRTYASALSLVRPRGINDKGTLDEYRRPKAAYRVVRQIFRGAPPAS